MDLIVDPPGRLLCHGRAYRCAIGRGGIAAEKREGDGVTPVGTYPLRRVYYRADRLRPPRTGLDVTALAPADGWSDAPDDLLYNTFVQHPHAHSAERLWRDDRLYDLIVVIGYNDDPVTPGKGSAIFMHVAKPDYAPTEGCVALSEPDLIAVLSECGGDSRIVIRELL